MRKKSLSIYAGAVILSLLLLPSCTIRLFNAEGETPEIVDKTPRIELFSFGLPGERVIINDSAGTIEVSLLDTVLLTQTPTILHTGDGIDPEAGEEQDFSEPVAYRVWKDSGEERSYTVSVSTYSLANPGSVILTASRTTGVGPLSVFFSASFSDSDDPAIWFHEYEFEWDFGDSSGETWATTGLSKNEATGPVAGHVYESPGFFTVNLTVRQGGTTIDTASVNVTVDDPDTTYSGSKTVCVSPHSDFSGAPPGALKVVTSDLSSIAHYATAGSRILLRRGASWSVSDLGDQWPSNGGPVTIGAFGTGARPFITVTDGTFLDIADKRDWRIMDLELRDDTKSHGVFGGNFGMQRILFLRVKTRGFVDGISWGHWNNANYRVIDQMAIVECDIAEAEENVSYVGSERLMILGSTFANAAQSHVLRVWQAYQGVISGNILSGSSVSSGSGRHALKLHGPGEDELGEERNTDHLAHRTEYVVVSDNLFGSSGPWPVNIAPQNAAADERLSHIVFERNRYFADFGEPNGAEQLIGLRIAASYVTVRNNVIDGSGWGEYFTGIEVTRDGGAIPDPVNVALYNNTIYKSGNKEGEEWFGIRIKSDVRSSIVKNNLVSFPDCGRPTLLKDSGQYRSSGGNLFAPDAAFANAGAATPLDRDFALRAGSAGIDEGVEVPVYDDMNGNARPQGNGYDVGAGER